jgi:putative oxidoreductase
VQRGQRKLEERDMSPPAGIVKSSRFIGALGRPVLLVAGALDLLQPLLALGLRFWVGLQFWQSGLLKIRSWDSTLYLFREEYRTPVLSPEFAAVAGTFGELLFPSLLFAGLYGRLAAIGLAIVNAMAVVSYRHVLLAEGFEAAFGQHVLWGLMLVVLVVYGPGKVSLDHFLFARDSAATRV